MYNCAFRLLALVGILIIATAARAQDGPMSAVSSQDNRFEVFFESPAGIQHFWQLPGPVIRWNPNPAIYQPAPDMNRDVSGFVASFTDFRSTIVAARDGGGRVMVAWIVNGKVYFAAADTPSSSLNGRGAIPGTANVQSLAIAKNQDGRLELFTLIDGYLRSYRQQATGSWIWSAPQVWTLPQREPRTPTPRLKMVSVTPYRDGRLLVIGVRQPDGTVIAYEQPSPNTTPVTNSPYVTLGGNQIRSIVARESIDRRWEIFAHGGDSLVYHIYESTSGGNSGWQVMTQQQIRAPIQVVVNGDGRMEVIARLRASGVLSRIYQVEPNGGWSTSWSDLCPSRESAEGPLAATTTPSGVSGVFEYSLTERRLKFSIEDLFLPGTLKIPAWSPKYGVTTPAMK